MTKKSFLATAFLVCLGVLFGAVLISGFKTSDSDNNFFPVSDKDVVVGVKTPLSTSSFDAKNLSRAFREVAKVLTPAVVSITVTSKSSDESVEQVPEQFHDFFKFFGPGNPRGGEPMPRVASGSGVIITHDGYIATNNHVVEDADDNGIEVTLDDKSKYKAKLIGTDPSTDLAVIKIDGAHFPAAAIGNSDSAEVGDWVLAIGNPLGLTSTVTAGIVSAIGRGNIGVIHDGGGYAIENFIQTDAAINPGNSGGPLVNLRGEIVGINSAIATTNARYQGYGFAIPSNLMKSVTEDLIKHGKVQRGYIGVQIQTLDETMAKALGLHKVRGVLVQAVTEGGAGEEAGLKQGDVILAVDDVDVFASNELQSQIARHHPGETVTLKIFRDKREIETKITLRAKTESSLSSADSEKDEEIKKDESSMMTKSFDKLGLTVKTLPNDARKKLHGGIGILVTNVKPFSEAAKRALERDDILLEADGKAISSVKDFEKIIEEHANGDPVLLRVKKSNGQVSLIAIEIPA